ncbi:hypothetical protein ACUOA8_22325, partial [Escherichia sp. SS-MK2]
MHNIFSSPVMPFRAPILACWKEKYPAARLT